MFGGQEWIAKLKRINSISVKTTRIYATKQSYLKWEHVEMCLWAITIRTVDAGLSSLLVNIRYGNKNRSSLHHFLETYLIPYTIGLYTALAFANSEHQMVARGVILALSNMPA